MDSRAPQARLRRACGALRMQGRLQILPLSMVLVLLLASLPSPSLAVNGGKVMKLDADNFNTAIRENKFVLLSWHSTTCTACEDVSRKLEDAAEKLHAAGSPVLVASCDGNFWGALRDKYGVMRYPTLQWFKYGEMQPYTGGADSAMEIVEWASRKGRPWAAKPDTPEKLKALEATEIAIILAYFKEPKGEAYDTFFRVGDDIEDVRFAVTSDAATAKAAGLKREGVVALTNFEDEARAAVPYKGKLTDEAALRAFVSAEKLPLSIEFKPAHEERIYNRDVPKQLFLLSHARDVVPGGKPLETFREVSKEFRGRLVFVHAALEVPATEPLLKHFGAGGQEYPLVLGLASGAGGGKYMHRGGFNQKELAEFARSVVNGTAQHYYKSANVPEKAKEKGVTVVVSKEFHRIVNDPTKDVLLEVYAPWCEHCKKLEPIMSKLAQRFKDVDSVVIAKMNGEENEHPMVAPRGYPSLFFFPASSEMLVTPYDNGEKPRTLKALTEFVLQQARTPVSDDMLYHPPKLSEEEREEKKLQRHLRTARREIDAKGIYSTGTMDDSSKSFVEGMIKEQLRKEVHGEL